MNNQVALNFMHKVIFPEHHDLYTVNFAVFGIIGTEQVT